VKLRKIFRYRMEPTRIQREVLSRMAGARRFIWNWALAQCQDHYREHATSLPQAELSRRLTVLKQQPETVWLKDVDSQALQQVLADLRRAYLNFFAKRSRFPRFKSRKTDKARFRIPQRVSVADGTVSIPKVGCVRIRQSRPIDGQIKSATFTRDAADRWHVSLVIEFTMPDTPLVPANHSAVVGVDLGLYSFLKPTSGSEVPAPKFFRKQQRKLRRAQRELSRRQKASARRLRAKHKVARLQRHVADQRKDFLHKITTALVRNYEGICIEDLNVKGLVRTKLAKSFSDASFGEFRRQLKYKAVWNRRHLVVISRWFPSSKACHMCGCVNDSLTLKDRWWTCCCGTQHDRDFNAALNILSEGLKLIPLAAGHAERLNARGPDVRLPLGATGVETRIPRL